jgi:hypothetical protein
VQVSHILASGGGNVTANFTSPGSAGQLYALMSLLEFPPLSLDQALPKVENTAAASTTGGTIGPTATLAKAPGVVLSASVLTAGTGLPNANIALAGFNSIAQSQDTANTIGAVHGYQSTANTSPVTANFTWTADASQQFYQLGLVAYFDGQPPPPSPIAIRPGYASRRPRPFGPGIAR